MDANLSWQSEQKGIEVYTQGVSRTVPSTTYCVNIYHVNMPLQCRDMQFTEPVQTIFGLGAL